MIFRRAILRLTLTYTAVQLVLFAAFAAGVYLFVTGTFDFDAAATLGEGAASAAEQGFVALRTGLAIALAALLVIVPVTSFLMARAALSPIRRSYELQQQFVDGASHELRSPLSVIQGELELALSRSRTPAQYQAAIGSALDSVGSLTQLTNDLLLLSRDSGGELQRTFRPVPLVDLIHRVVAGRSPADRANVTVSAEPGMVIVGSPELLFRAVGNVLDNALKFSPPNGQVVVTAGAHAGSAVLTVRDEGAGMTESEKSHAFDRFWRSASALATPGHGLGLPLVRQICAAHAGRISITSAAGAGTSVTMTLPLAR